MDRSSRFLRFRSQEQSRNPYHDSSLTASAVAKSPFIPRYRQIDQQRYRRYTPLRPSLQLRTGGRLATPAESPSIARSIFSLPLELRQVIYDLALSRHAPDYIKMMRVCKEFHREVSRLMLRAGAYFDSPIHFAEWTAVNGDLASTVTSVNIPLINVLCGISRSSYPTAWQQVVSLYRSVALSLFHGMIQMPNVKYLIIRSAEDVECSIGRFNPPRFYSDLLLGWITAVKSDLVTLHFPQRITSLRPFQALSHIRVLRINAWSNSTPEVALEVLRSLKHLTELHLISKDNPEGNDFGIDEFGNMQGGNILSVNAHVIKHMQPLKIISITDQAPTLALLTVEMADAIFSAHSDTVRKVNFYGWTQGFGKQYELHFGPNPDLEGIVARLTLSNVGDPWRIASHHISSGPFMPSQDAWSCCITRPEYRIGR